MKRAFALLVACGASALPAEPRLAAPVREPRFDQKTSDINYAYAECVVQSHHKLAAEAIIADATNGEINKHYSDLIDSVCLASQAGFGSEMRFGGDFYRYALAGALIRRDLAARSLDDLALVAPLDHRQVEDRETVMHSNPNLSKSKQAELEKHYNQSVSASFLSQYGECVVRADPAGAKAVLFSKPTKPDEAAAFRVLMPALQACMSTGTTLTFGPLMLRGALALNYYRLAYAPRVAAPTKTVN